MTSASPLSDRTKKDLADMARRRGIRGWETMKREDLIKVLSTQPAKTKSAQPTAKPPVPPPAKTPTATKPAPTSAKPSKPLPAKPAVNGSANGAAKPASPKPAAASKTSSAPKPQAVAAKPPAPAKAATPAAAGPAMDPAKDLSFPSKSPAVAVTKDRIILMVPDPFWLHAYWELTHQSVQRAEAALRQDWHGARPIIRIFDVTSTDTTSTSETPLRDIIVHGGCNNWYIDIQQPPRAYRADIGYLSKRGDFFVLARSNVVTPPKAGTTEALDVNWAEMDTKKAERILTMSTGFQSTGDPELKELFEERLRRPMGAPKDSGFGSGATLPGALKKFFFEIEAELIVYGKTDPGAHVTLQNEPVKLRPDGTFTMLFSLPDSRQIIPAVATSHEGSEERTVVLAVERNTKYLDPMIHDQMNEH